MTRIDEGSLETLGREGIVRVPGFFDRELVSRCRSELIALVSGSDPNPHVMTTNESVHVHNFFLHGSALRRVLFGPEMRRLHEVAFGPHYTLRNAVASSIQEVGGSLRHGRDRPIGEGWHRDTPQFVDRHGRSRVLGPGITFQIIVSVDASNRRNSTKVIPGSHDSDVEGHRPDRATVSSLLSELGSVELLLEPGDIGIIDDNLIHRAGEGSAESRWMLFCSYTPWYVKPYFDYPQLRLEHQTAYEDHCLHRASKPPSPLEALENTLRLDRWNDSLHGECATSNEPSEETST